MIAMLLSLAAGVPVPPAALPAPRPGDCDLPAELGGAPPPEDGPLPVEVRVFVVDVVELNEAREAATLDFFVAARWRDARLSARSLGRSLESCRLSPDDLWHPELFFINRRRLFPDEPSIHVDAEGNVLWRQRYYGELSQPMNLARLPFDRQVLRLRVASTAPPDVIEIRPDPGSGLYEDAAVPGWIIESFQSSVGLEYIPGPDVTISVLEVRIGIHRDVGFYTWRLFLPLVLITLMASAVFYIPPKNLGPQIGVATASIFSLIAFLLGTRNYVPRISYLTVAEELNVAAMGMVFLALGVAITSGSLADRGREDLAVRIERVARWVYPLLGVALATYVLS